MIGDLYLGELVVVLQHISLYISCMQVLQDGFLSNWDNVGEGVWIEVGELRAIDLNARERVLRVGLHLWRDSIDGCCLGRVVRLHGDGRRRRDTSIEDNHLLLRVLFDNGEMQFGGAVWQGDSMVSACAEVKCTDVLHYNRQQGVVV